MMKSYKRNSNKKEEKKIIHIIDNIKTGGAELLLVSTIKCLPEFKHYVIILTNQIDIQEVKKYASVICIHHTGWYCLLASCWKINKIVKSIKPDIVHSHLFLSSFITRLSLPWFKNIFFTVHNQYSSTIFKSKVKTFLEKFVYKDNHHLISVSRSALE